MAMGYSKFFQEILADRLATDHQGILPYIPFIKSHLSGDIIDAPTRENIPLKVFDKSMNVFDFLNDNKGKNENTDKPEAGVLVIPIHGLLTKFGDWWDYGTEEIAQFLFDAYADSSIKAIVLQVHSGGGTVHSIFPLEAAIRKRNKPVIAAIDSKSFSAALFVSVLADRVIAVNPMSEVGSIGIMSRIMDDSEWLKSEGIRIIEIYPPESNWKNRSINEALKGNTKLIIQEELTPWAVHFQETVRANRPKLDESVEGILAGRTFYAQDAIKNGLVDSIMAMDDVIQYAFDYTQKEIYQFMNN